jgi:hypothetical protein
MQMDVGEASSVGQLGCPSHWGKTSEYNTAHGNPINHAVWKNFVEKMEENCNHVKRGRKPFSIRQIKDISLGLLRRDSAYDLMICVLINIASTIYLREEEVVDFSEPRILFCQ